MNHSNLPKGWHFATNRELDNLPTTPRIHTRINEKMPKDYQPSWPYSCFEKGDCVGQDVRCELYYILPNRTRNLPPPPAI